MQTQRHVKISFQWLLISALRQGDVKYFRTSHRTQPWPSKLIFLHFGDASKALAVHLLDRLMGLADMLPICPHPHMWRESSTVMCSSLVILLWLKTPSAHKVLPLPVWSLLILGLGKAWNWLRAWYTQGNMVTVVFHVLSFSFGLAGDFPKFQCEFQKSVGGAEWKVMERTRTLMRNWKCAELKLIYTQGPSEYAGLKEIYSHYDEQAHPQLIKCKKEAYVRY